MVNKNEPDKMYIDISYGIKLSGENKAYATPSDYMWMQSGIKGISILKSAPT